MIIYEDNEIVVALKKIGLISQTGDNGTQSMVSLLEEKCSCRIYPVHRLDKDVGGLMVFAKTQRAAAELSRQVSEREMIKNYLAVTDKEYKDTEGLMEDLLFFDKQRNKSFVVGRERKGVKKAVLRYRLIDSKEGKFLYGVSLETGRTHQIRVQFASRKMPLSGDRKYGSKSGGNIGLFSSSLSFKHPKTGESMVFTAKPESEAFALFK